MRERLSHFIIVEVIAERREWSRWISAAALEPALPTWVGPPWGQLMATQPRRDPAALSVTLTRDLYKQLAAEDCPSAVPYIVHHLLTEQASDVLRGHGLQPIREKRPCQPAEYIPF